MEIIGNPNLIKDNCVYVSQEKELCQLIIGPNNINYYSNGVSNVNSCDKNPTDLPLNFIFQKYDYNKMYLNFFANNKGYGLTVDYFSKGDQDVYWFYGSDFYVELDQRKCQFESSIENREDLEKFYNSFESLYLVNTLGDLLYAKVNGEVKKQPKEKSILPTDEEICLLDQQERKNKYLISCALNSQQNTRLNKKEANRLRTIDEIKNLKIFAPPVAITIKSSNLLIGVKNGFFEIYWYNLTYVKDGLFELTLAPVNIFAPNYENEIEQYKRTYLKNNGPTKCKKYTERK